MQVDQGPRDEFREVAGRWSETLDHHHPFVLDERLQERPYG